MKNRHTIIVLFFLFFSINFSTAQDAAVVAFNTDSDLASPSDVDGYSIVALVDIPSTQNIYVTERVYDATTNSFPSNDGVVQITWTGTWTKGTIIRIEETTQSSNLFNAVSSTNGPASPGASMVEGSFSIGGNEGLSVFTSTTPGDPANNVTEIYSYLESSSTSNDSPNVDGDCPCSTDFVEVDFTNSSVDAGQFTIGLRSGAVSLADFNNTANWTTSGTNITMDLTEFANLTFGGSGLLVPVDLTAFTANLEDQGTLLNWQTASEENNDYFQVERSVDGRNFFAIGQVDGNGSTNVALSYDYLDPSPAIGKNYYRLKQVDYNGAFEYSKTIAVEVKSVQNKLSVLPNPTDSEMTLSLAKATEQDTNIEIFTAYGQLVFMTILEKDQHTKDLDLSTLSAGTYLLRVNVNNQIHTQQIIKL